MVSRFLITTPLEETWPDNPNAPVLFLGEWCRLYARKERWSKMDAVVLPYHWDDRQKLYNDYQYLNNIYEIMLKAMKDQLNETHRVDHSLRYWRILIGPWLGHFLQVVFDRWSMLKVAIENYGIIGCKVLLKEESTFIPNDFKHSDNLWIDDKWNEAMYSQLLQENWKDSFLIEIIRKNNDQTQQTYHNNGLSKSFFGRIRKFSGKKYKIYKNHFSHLDKYFFFKTYLPTTIENEILFRLGQKPKFWETPNVPKIQANMKMRKWQIDEADLYDQFSLIVSRMIPYNIPTVYLDGYNTLLDCIETVGWPKNPKYIFTSNEFFSNEIFKAWSAQKVENGTRLIIGQHGGHYGIGLWSWIEEHEISISDRYLSWGWSDPDQPKIRPVGQLKHKMPIGVNHIEQTGLLLVTGTLPRYSYMMYSVVVSSQWLSYLEDQFSFTENLNPLIQNDMLVRLYVHDYGWEQEKRWNDRFPNLALDLGKKNINELIAKSRLFVSTYNAATYLESFTMDVPTVIFWNPKYWEIRDAAIPYFDELKRVGIFHETPESAAMHVSEVWDNVDEWWHSKPVRKALNQFKSQYSDIYSDITGNIEAELRAEFNKS